MRSRLALLAIASALLPACQLEIASVPTYLALVVSPAPDGSARLALDAVSVADVGEVQAVPGPLAALRTGPVVERELVARGASISARIRFWQEQLVADVADVGRLRLDDLTFRRDADDAVHRLAVTIPIGRRARWMERFPLYTPSLVREVRARRDGLEHVVAAWCFEVVAPPGWVVSDARVDGLDGVLAPHAKQSESDRQASLSLESAFREVDDDALTWTIVYRRE